VNLTLIGAAIAFAMGFSVAWGTQTLRIQHADKQRSEIALESERLVSRQESARSAQVLAAQNNRAKRESKLRLDAVVSRNAADELRTQSDAALQAARTSHDACLVRAIAYSVVLDQCVTQYQELGRAASGHVSDIQALTDSWGR